MELFPLNPPIPPLSGIKQTRSKWIGVSGLAKLSWNRLFVGLWKPTSISWFCTILIESHRFWVNPWGAVFNWKMKKLNPYRHSFDMHTRDRAHAQALSLVGPRAPNPIGLHQGITSSDTLCIHQQKMHIFYVRFNYVLHIWTNITAQRILCVFVCRGTCLGEEKEIKHKECMDDQRNWLKTKSRPSTNLLLHYHITFGP